MNSKRLTVKSISIILIAAFVCQDFAHAAPEIGRLALSLTPVVRVNLPPSVARMDKIHRFSGSTKTLILIEDAHTNESAQLNIAKSIEGILQSEKIRAVFLEAGTGDDSLSDLRSLTSFTHRKRVAKSYLTRGLIQGPDYLDLTSDLDFKLWGVEDKALYAKGLEHYCFLKERREHLNAYLDTIRRAVFTLKHAVFNPSLFQFDQQRERYLSGDLPLTEYFQALASRAGNLGLPLDRFKNFSKLQTLKDKESKIDFVKAGEEQAKAVASLNLADQKEIFKVDTCRHETQKAFFASLEEELTHPVIPTEAEGSGLTSKIPRLPSVARNDSRMTYPELFKYFDYLKEAGAIDARALLNETQDIEAALYLRLVRSDDERKLLSASGSEKILRNLFNLTLSVDEFQKIEAAPQDFNLTEIAGFLNRKLMNLKTHYEDAVFLDDQSNEALPKAVEFYRLTESRDRAFVQNALKKMSETGEDKAVLVTGGYHTAHLSDLLKKAGISYAVITPQIYQETNQEKYEALLLGKNPEKKNVVTSQNQWAVKPGREMEGVYPGLKGDLLALAGARMADGSKETPPHKSSARRLLNPDQIAEIKKHFGSIFTEIEKKLNRPDLFQVNTAQRVLDEWAQAVRYLEKGNLNPIYLVLIDGILNCLAEQKTMMAKGLDKAQRLLAKGIMDGLAEELKGHAKFLQVIRQSLKDENGARLASKTPDLKADGENLSWWTRLWRKIADNFDNGFGQRPKKYGQERKAARILLDTEFPEEPPASDEPPSAARMAGILVVVLMSFALPVIIERLGHFIAARWLGAEGVKFSKLFWIIHDLGIHFKEDTPDKELKEQWVSASGVMANVFASITFFLISFAFADDPEARGWDMGTIFSLIAGVNLGNAIYNTFMNSPDSRKIWKRNGARMASQGTMERNLLDNLQKGSNLFLPASQNQNQSAGPDAGKGRFDPSIGGSGRMALDRSREDVLRAALTEDEFDSTLNSAYALRYLKETQIFSNDFFEWLAKHGQMTHVLYGISDIELLSEPLDKDSYHKLRDFLMMLNAMLGTSFDVILLSGWQALVINRENLRYAAAEDTGPRPEGTRNDGGRLAGQSQNLRTDPISQKVGTIRLQNVASWVPDLSEEWVKNIFDLVEPGGQIVLVGSVSDLIGANQIQSDPIPSNKLAREIMFNPENALLMRRFTNVLLEQKSNWDVMGGHVDDAGNLRLNMSGYLKPLKSGTSAIYDNVIIFQKKPNLAKPPTSKKETSGARLASEVNFEPYQIPLDLEAARDLFLAMQNSKVTDSGRLIDFFDRFERLIGQGQVSCDITDAFMRSGYLLNRIRLLSDTSSHLAESWERLRQTLISHATARTEALNDVFALAIWRVMTGIVSLEDSEEEANPKTKQYLEMAKLLKDLPQVLEVTNFIHENLAGISDTDAVPDAIAEIVVTVTNVSFPDFGPIDLYTAKEIIITLASDLFGDTDTAQGEGARLAKLKQSPEFLDRELTAFKDRSESAVHKHKHKGSHKGSSLHLHKGSSLHLDISINPNGAGSRLADVSQEVSNQRLDPLDSLATVLDQWAVLPGREFGNVYVNLRGDLLALAGARLSGELLKYTALTDPMQKLRRLRLKHFELQGELEELERLWTPSPKIYRALRGVETLKQAFGHLSRNEGVHSSQEQFHREWMIAFERMSKLSLKLINILTTVGAIALWDVYQNIQSRRRAELPDYLKEIAELTNGTNTADTTPGVGLGDQGARLAKEPVEASKPLGRVEPTKKIGLLLGLLGLILGINHWIERVIISYSQKLYVGIYDKDQLKSAKLFYDQFFENWKGEIVYVVKPFTPEEKISLINYQESPLRFLVGSAALVGIMVFIIFKRWSSPVESEKEARLMRYLNAGFYLGIYGIVANVTDTLIYHGVFDWIFGASPGDMLMVGGVIVILYGAYINRAAGENKAAARLAGNESAHLIDDLVSEIELSYNSGRRTIDPSNLDTVIRTFWSEIPPLMNTGKKPKPHLPLYKDFLLPRLKGRASYFMRYAPQFDFKKSYYVHYAKKLSERISASSSDTLDIWQLGPGYMQEPIENLLLTLLVLRKKGMDREVPPIRMHVFERGDSLGILEKLRGNQVRYSENEIKILETGLQNIVSDVQVSIDEFFEQDGRGYKLKDDFFKAFVFYEADLLSEESKRQAFDQAPKPDTIFMNFTANYLKEGQAQKAILQILDHMNTGGLFYLGSNDFLQLDPKTISSISVEPKSPEDTHPLFYVVSKDAARLADTNPHQKWPIPQTPKEAMDRFEALRFASQDEQVDFLTRFEQAVNQGGVKKEVVTGIMRDPKIWSYDKIFSERQPNLWSRLMNVFRSLRLEILLTDAYNDSLGIWRSIIGLQDYLKFYTNMNFVDLIKDKNKMTQRILYLSIHDEAVGEIATYVRDETGKLKASEDVSDAVAEQLMILQNLFLIKPEIDLDTAKQIIFDLTQFPLDGPSAARLAEGNLLRSKDGFGETRLTYHRVKKPAGEFIIGGINRDQAPASVNRRFPLLMGSDLSFNLKSIFFEDANDFAAGEGEPTQRAGWLNAEERLVLEKFGSWSVLDAETDPTGSADRPGNNQATRESERSGERDPGRFEDLGSANSSSNTLPSSGALGQGNLLGPPDQVPGSAQRSGQLRVARNNGVKSDNGSSEVNSHSQNIPHSEGQRKTTPLASATTVSADRRRSIGGARLAGVRAEIDAEIDAIAKADYAAVESKVRMLDELVQNRADPFEHISQVGRRLEYVLTLLERWYSLNFTFAKSDYDALVKIVLLHTGKKGEQDPILVWVHLYSAIVKAKKVKYDHPGKKSSWYRRIFRQIFDVAATQAIAQDPDHVSIEREINVKPKNTFKAKEASNTPGVEPVDLGARLAGRQNSGRSPKGTFRTWSETGNPDVVRIGSEGDTLENPSAARLADANKPKWPIPQTRDEARRVYTELATADHEDLFEFLKRFERAISDGKVKSEVITEFSKYLKDLHLWVWTRLDSRGKDLWDRVTATVTSIRTDLRDALAYELTLSLWENMIYHNRLDSAEDHLPQEQSDAERARLLSMHRYVTEVVRYIDEEARPESSEQVPDEIADKLRLLQNAFFDDQSVDLETAKEIIFTLAKRLLDPDDGQNPDAARLAEKTVELAADGVAHLRALIDVIRTRFLDGPESRKKRVFLWAHGTKVNLVEVLNEINKGNLTMGHGLFETELKEIRKSFQNETVQSDPDLAEPLKLLEENYPKVFITKAEVTPAEPAPAKDGAESKIASPENGARLAWFNRSAKVHAVLKKNFSSEILFKDVRIPKGFFKRYGEPLVSVSRSGEVSFSAGFERIFGERSESLKTSVREHIDEAMRGLREPVSISLYPVGYFHDHRMYHEFLFLRKSISKKIKDNLVAFRDREERVHMPLDYFVPGVDPELQKRMARQAILAAVSKTPEEFASKQKEDLRELFLHSGLFEFKDPEEISKRLDGDERIFIAFLFGDRFKSLWNPIQYDKRVSTPGLSGEKVKSALKIVILECLSQVYESDVFLDADIFYREISPWMPPRSVQVEDGRKIETVDISRVITDYVKYGSVKYVDRFSVEDWILALRHAWASQELRASEGGGLLKRIEALMSKYDGAQELSTSKLAEFLADNHISLEELFGKLFIDWDVLLFQMDGNFIKKFEEHLRNVDLPENVLIAMPAPKENDRVISGGWSTEVYFERATWQDVADAVNGFIETGETAPFLRFYEGAAGGAKEITEGIVAQLKPWRDRYLQSHKREFYYFPDFGINTRDEVPDRETLERHMRDYLRQLDAYAKKVKAPKIMMVFDLGNLGSLSGHIFRLQKPSVNDPDLMHVLLKSEEFFGGRGVVTAHIVYDLDEDDNAPLAPSLRFWPRGVFGIKVGSELASTSISTFPEPGDPYVFGNFDYALITVERRPNEGRTPELPTPVQPSEKDEPPSDEAPNLSGPLELSGAKVGARLAEKPSSSLQFFTSRLSRFFGGVAYAAGKKVVEGREIPVDLGEDHASVFKFVRAESGLEAVSRNGLHVRLETKQIESAPTGGPTHQDLRALRGTVIKRVNEALDTVKISTADPVVVEMNLDFMGRDLFDQAKEDMLLELKEELKKAYAQNVHILPVGRLAKELAGMQGAEGVFLDQIPVELKGAPKVKMGAPAPGVQIAVRPLSGGHIFTLEPFFKLAAYTGRTDLSKPENIPAGLHAAYETLADQTIETQTVWLILSGQADLHTLARHALRAVAKVDLNRAARFYSLMKRMLQQAA